MKCALLEFARWIMVLGWPRITLPPFFKGWQGGFCHPKGLFILQCLKLTAMREGGNPEFFGWLEFLVPGFRGCHDHIRT
jgi:hypothetical protein